MFVQVIAVSGLGTVGLLSVTILAAGSLHIVTSARRRVRRISTFSDAIRSTLGAYGREEAVDELLTAVAGLVRADDSTIVLAQGSRGSVAQVATRRESGSRGLRPARLTTAERSLLDALRVQQSLMRSGRRTPPALQDVLSERGLARGMAVALRGESDAIGMLFVGRRGGRPFGSDDRDLFALIADHAGAVLENDRLERSLREVTSLKEELRHRADHDILTGLPNRALFATRVGRALDDPAAAHRIAVLFLDLDDFKVVNDTLGHHAGDELLLAVARRVAQVIRPTDLAARLGGDEFAVLVNCLQDDDGERIAARLVEALDAPFSIEGRETVVHASVGVAYARPGRASADEVLRSADLAMYEAKQSGKRRHASYEPAMQERIRRRHVLVSALERATLQGEIDVHFQPIVDLETGAVTAVEALARWNRPVVGLVEPGGFIAIADEVGLMSAIGQTVLREACRQTRSWQRLYRGHERLGVAVNLAPSELHRATLVSEVAAILEETELAPSSLTLEITESGVMRQPDVALRAMTELRALGVSLALDDFGTGHSSLAHLRSFPLDVLKIAQPFVAGLGGEGPEPAFVETIVRLAAALDLDVVAEGIETTRQATIVAALDCGLGQGYHFGRPVGPLGMTAYLDADRLPPRSLALTTAA